MMRYHPKRGEAHIKNCVMIVVICMLLSVFLTFSFAVNIVKQVERNSRVVLDNYVMTDAIDIYNSIKQGSDKDESLNASRYQTALSEFCTFVKQGNFYYNYDDDGNVQYYISAPTLGYTDSGTLKIYTTYNVYVPVYFAGIKVGTANVPLTVTSKLKDKF